MTPAQWRAFRSAATPSAPDTAAVPLALIVDSPWIPGFLGISTLDYLTVPETWLDANFKVLRRFPDITFLPGFWAEIGMCAEPSAFGCRVSLYPDRTPIAHPLIRSMEELDRVPQPNPLTDGFLPLVLSQYRRLRPAVEAAGYVVKMVAARGPLTTATHLMGVTNFLLALKLQPAETHRLLRVTTTLTRQWLEAQAEAAGDIEAVLVLDDIAGMMSARDYQEFAAPCLKEVFDAFPGALKLFHNDTDNPVSYPFLRELGIHVFNFTHLQPIAKVRRLVGPGITLLGNVPPLEILANGTPEEVRASAQACIAGHRNAGPGSLVLSAGGGTSPGTPAANLDALVAAARDTASSAPAPPHHASC